MTYQDFFKRLLLVALLVITGFILWRAADIFLLLFFSVLLAIILRSISKPLAGRTPLSDKTAVLAVVVALLLLLASFGFLFAPNLAEQTEQFFDRLPQILSELEETVQQLPFGNYLVQRFSFGNSDESGEANSANNAASVSDTLSQASEIISTSFDAAVYLLFVLFSSLFLALNPGLYKGGLLKLIPQSKRARAGDVIELVILTLRAWLTGRLISMAGVAILTTLGLWLLGIPLALFLGLLAGLLDFVPLIGPFIAAFPAVLFAFVEAPMLGLYVALLYFVVQQIESYVITPLAQQMAVHLPPVLTILAVLIMHLLFGFMGALVATPLLAAIVVLVKTLYIEDVLHDEVEIQAAEQKG